MNMLSVQLQYDAMKILGFDEQVFARIAEEFGFVQHLAGAGKIVQGIFIAHEL